MQNKNNKKDELQLDAINSFNKYYYEEKNTRGILSACCGYGKSYLMYKIIKESAVQFAFTPKIENENIFKKSLKYVICGSPVKYKSSCPYATNCIKPPVIVLFYFLFGKKYYYYKHFVFIII